jgi:hypothetical protein
VSEPAVTNIPETPTATVEPPERGPFEQYDELLTLPRIGDAIAAASSNIVRDFTRAVLVEPAIKRQFGIGMGIVKFETPIVTYPEKGRAEIVMTAIEAPAAVQQRALAHIISIGVPPKIEQGGGPIRGVIVLGEAGLVEARVQAERDRIAATGPPQLQREYIPPPGYETLVIEDDLSGPQVPTSPDEAPSSPAAAAPVQSKARELAAKRRSRKPRR